MSDFSKVSPPEPERKEDMATWSLAGRHAGPDKPPTPVFINLDNALTIDRQNGLTTVTMVGGEQVYIARRHRSLLQCAQS